MGKASIEKSNHRKRGNKGFYLFDNSILLPFIL
jgi:hypothetical protein